MDLLILDDWGPDRLTAPQRRDLMEIVEERYGRRSTLITSQLPVETWHDVIAEPTFTDAILDRLVHNAYRIALDGPSLRKIGTDNWACIASLIETCKINGVDPFTYLVATLDAITAGHLKSRIDDLTPWAFEPASTSQR